MKVIITTTDGLKVYEDVIFIEERIDLIELRDVEDETITKIPKRQILLLQITL